MTLAEYKLPEFEKIFHIPANHHLVAVRSRSRGGSTIVEFWEHEEYDAFGRTMARYESYEELTPAGARHGCWRKFDMSGRLVTVGGSLH